MAEVMRYASPVEAPQGIAWDGTTMWMTSAATGRVYAVDPQSWTVRHEFFPPAEALGITYTGVEFRLILAPLIEDPDLERDRRYVYAFSPEIGFSECFACPNDSGSFLAYDEGTLYVSQAWDKKIIELDERGSSRRQIPLDRRPVGMTIVQDSFYLVTVDDQWNDGHFERLGMHDDPSAMQFLHSFPFKPRSVAFDGNRFWIADRNSDALVSLTF